MESMKLGAVSLDCANVHETAEFYSRLTGTPIGFETPEFAAIQIPGMWIAFHHVDGYESPSWPENDHPKQMHVDFAVADLDDAEEFVLRSGGTKAEHQPNPGGWRVFRDPAGHPFCVTVLIPS